MVGSPEYWNHNTAYHRWLVGIATQHRGDVLDVGCGDGLLAQRLAPVSRSVTAIDPDARAVQRGTDRLALESKVSVSHAAFEEFEPAHRFDLIAFVASLHHMDLRSSLIKAREMLARGCEITVVALSANRTVRDWVWAALCVPPARIGSWWHGETHDIGIVANPREGLGDIRRVAAEVLPGVSVRRGLYYRYLLRRANR